MPPPLWLRALTLLASLAVKVVVVRAGDDDCGVVEHTIFGGGFAGASAVVIVTCGDFFPGINVSDNGAPCPGLAGVYACISYLNAVYAAERNYTYTFFKYEKQKHGSRSAVWCRVPAVRAAMQQHPGATFLYLDLDAVIVTNSSISSSALTRMGRHRALLVDSDAPSWRLQDPELHTMRGVQGWFESEEIDALLIERDCINDGFWLDVGPDASISAFLDFWWSIGASWKDDAGHPGYLLTHPNGDQRALSIALGLRRDLRKDAMVLKSARDPASAVRGSADLFGGPSSKCIRHFLGPSKQSGEAQSSLGAMVQAAKRRFIATPRIEML